MSQVQECDFINTRVQDPWAEKSCTGVVSYTVYILQGRRGLGRAQVSSYFWKQGFQDPECSHNCQEKVIYYCLMKTQS